MALGIIVAMLIYSCRNFHCLHPVRKNKKKSRVKDKKKDVPEKNYILLFLTIGTFASSEQTLCTNSFNTQFYFLEYLLRFK